MQENNVFPPPLEISFWGISVNRAVCIIRWYLVMAWCLYCHDKPCCANCSIYSLKSVVSYLLISDPCRLLPQVLLRLSLGLFVNLGINLLIYRDSDSVVIYFEQATLLNLELQTFLPMMSFNLPVNGQWMSLDTSFSRKWESFRKFYRHTESQHRK